MQRREGDWDCPKCKSIVFKSKKYCIKCKIDKDGLKAPFNSQYNDWRCLSCNDLQFAKNYNCRKCGTPKHKEGSNKPINLENTIIEPDANHNAYNTKTGFVIKLGDWLCPMCGDHQFAKNTKCRKCNAYNPNITLSKNNESNTTDNNNECVVCMARPKSILFRHTGKTDGHLCCCEPCGKDLFKNGKECPICRLPISELIKAF